VPALPVGITAGWQTLGRTAVHLVESLGSFTSGGGSDNATGFSSVGSVTAITGDTTFITHGEFSGTITTQNNSETIAMVSTLRLVEPSITSGTDTLTATATLDIVNAPTEGTDDYALVVQAGQSRFGAVGTNDGHVHILSPATGTVGLVVEMPSSATASAQSWQYNTVEAARIQFTATITNLLLSDRDLGDDNAGPGLRIGRNTNSTNSNTGSLRFADDGGTNQFVWVDNSASPGDVRVFTSPPGGATADTAGTVIGTQTSWHELKQNIKVFTDYQASLRSVLETTLYSFDQNGRHYGPGHVIYERDLGSWFSWNDDLSNDQVPSLNNRQILGVHSAAIIALNNKIEELRNEVSRIQSSRTVAMR